MKADSADEYDIRKQVCNLIFVLRPFLFDYVVYIIFSHIFD